MTAGVVAAGELPGQVWMYANYHRNLACTYCLTESAASGRVPRTALRRDARGCPLAAARSGRGWVDGRAADLLDHPDPDANDAMRVPNNVAEVVAVPALVERGITVRIATTAESIADAEQHQMSMTRPGAR